MWKLLCTLYYINSHAFINIYFIDEKIRGRLKEGYEISTHFPGINMSNNCSFNYNKTKLTLC